MRHFPSVLPAAARLAAAGAVLCVTMREPAAAEEPKPVTVVNSPVVTVGNTEANAISVRDVDSPSRAIAYFHQFDCTIGDGFGVCSSSDSLPSGMRAVIETISARARADVLDQKPEMAINFQADGHQSVMSLPLESQGPVTNPTGERYAALHPVRLYSDPGSTVIVVFTRNTTTGPVTTHVSVSGYLVPCDTSRGVPGCPAP